MPLERNLIKLTLFSLQFLRKELVPCLIFFLRLLNVTGLLLLLTACQNAIHKEHLVPTSFNALAGWQSDPLLQALPALKKSCQVILGRPAQTPMITREKGEGSAQDWKPFCQAIIKNHFSTTAELREFIEENLTPYKVLDNNKETGIFTGYYEPTLHGSRHRHGQFQTPLYKKPLASASHFSRSQIVKGALAKKQLELVWVDSPIDAFFLQIQGSGKVILENGQILRVGYAGQNGHPYVPIGKELVKRNYLQLSQVSMQSIRHWLTTHPSKAEEIMSSNPSYVYFKINHQDGPVGSYGVPLTPKRSLAVDRHYVSLGTPVWLDVSNPFVKEPPIQTLVSAQDTGGAIKGIIRGDLFFWKWSKSS